MKKILFAFSMMFALVACSYDDLGSIPQQPTADGPVQVRFSVQVPDMLQATRTMSSQAITSLKLVVFDENGYFVDDADAMVNGNASWNDNATPDDDNEIQEQTYTVSLPQSASPRTIHFIANLPANVEFDYGSERELINALETSGTDDAYWQRIELNSILGDVVSEDGKVTASAGSALAKALSEIPLVRNFAKVSVDPEDVKSVFTNVQIAVFNAPQRGKIAPYNTNAGEWAAYSDDTKYADLTAAGYYGYVPTLGDDDFANVGIDANDVISGTTQYLYEYNMDGKKIEAGSKYPFVIIAGSYQGHDTSYYKVDLVDASGKYLNILRNFDYTVVIESVSGDGYSSAAAAAAAAASNNINASIDTRNLLNISDGIGRLYVEYTTKYITDVTKPFTLKYKYVPNIQNQNTVDNDYVTTGSPTTTNPVDLSKVVAGDVIASYSVAGSDDADGWRTITITPKNKDNQDNPEYNGFGKEQQITISASTMSRTVKLHTVNPYALTVICPPTVASSVGQPVQITLQVPENLPEAIFPLEFVIVSDQLSPDASSENMPVRTGLNADGTEGGQHYGFVKTVTYEEYQQLTAVDGKVNIECNFKLSVAASVQGAVTTVNAYNPYFTCTPGSFVNVIPKKFTNVALSGNISRYGADQTGTLTFNTTNADDVVTVTLTGLQPANNNTVTLTPVEGKENTYTVTGSASYTINVKTTDWGTEPAAKLTADGYADVTVDADRNILYIPAGKITWQNVDDNNRSISLARLNGNSNEVVASLGTERDQSSDLVSETIDGLSADQEFYLIFRNDSNSGRRYSTTSFTAQEALDGVSNIAWTSNNTRPNYNN